MNGDPPVLLAPAGYRRMAWRNGLGMTTEIARREGEHGTFLWRASIAEIGGSGPFSAFPGHDRLIAVVEGGGISLAVGGAPPVECLPMGPVFAFPGEASVDCHLRGGPVRAFNLMVDRAAMTGEVSVLPGGTRHRLETGAGTTLAHALSGTLRMTPGDGDDDAFGLPEGWTAILDGGACILDVPDGAAGIMARMIARPTSAS